ncbi:hypothetical protein JJB07_11500 [Tumebacillus sp. ITR2]|uniref:Uncharacterized protein n=1 Tax=Tumebacillus amylolyticus TaxID=2801339 RepID=A0ABS1JAG6_9BACL|nr:hypothetical protein [Tumebacillus amylolyticus]MBL0387276.1 hypothetical protein [Tumebacillus amylolyticus]
MFSKNIDFFLESASDTELNSLLALYGRVDIEEIERPTIFSVGILDQYPSQLSEEEAARLLNFEINSSRFRMTEKKYLSFFKAALDDNDHFPIYAYSPKLSKINGPELQLILSSLDRKNMINLRKLVCSWKQENQPEVFRITNYDQILLLIQLSTRELCFSNFFFIKSKSVIVGNYDLSFPIYCLDEKMLDTYSMLARNKGLFIRRQSK